MDSVSLAAGVAGDVAVASQIQKLLLYRNSGRVVVPLLPIVNAAAAISVPVPIPVPIDPSREVIIVGSNNSNNNNDNGNYNNREHQHYV